MMNSIIIKGARQHNLKNINLEIPKNSLVVVTGVSGSGKSTLAFDTLYAEGQRRYVESLSAYARQFLELMEKPDVDSIEFLSPAISVEQKTVNRNPRSTVGTITEIYDYMRLLFARVGSVHCPKCGRHIESFTVQQIVDSVINYGEHSKLEILAPIARGKKGTFKNIFEKLLKEGFVRAYIDEKLYRLEDDIELDKNVKHTINVVVDRIVLKEGIIKRLTDSIETALKLSDGLVLIKCGDSYKLYSEKFACANCDISIDEVEPRIFSFNNPYGACPDCDGLGVKMVFDIDKIIPNKDLSIRQGAVKPWQNNLSFTFLQLLGEVSKKYNIDLDKSFKDLDENSKHIILYGAKEPLSLFHTINNKKSFYKKKFNGVINELREKLFTEDRRNVDYVKNFMSYLPCESCGGRRLKEESLSVKINGRNIYEISILNISKAYDFFENLTFTGFKKEVSSKIIKEIKRRLSFLLDVGLDYMTLDRRASTLSGGEAQRIRLATLIGSGLTGVLYVLDEPSIGLHQRDNDMLINTLVNLKSIGNTVIVVEHDEDTIRRADWIVDLGPGAGRKGGYLIYNGPPDGILNCDDSITGLYLSGKKSINIGGKKKVFNNGFVEIIGATEHNLKNIDVKFPLGAMICVTGVSGSGKSTLVIDVLYNGLKRLLYGTNSNVGKHKSIKGYGLIDKVIDVDQSPIGRTPRSNPATYTGILTDIRELFAAIPASKLRGYKPGRFSFNVKGGRCEKCQGEGFLKIEMHFLPDMYIKCDSCKGSRYNRDTLEIKYKEKSIAEVLDMTVNTAYEFFSNIPKLKNKLSVLKDVGLGYIKLGQSATTLSGGEAQRIKLARELMKKQTGKTLYIFDEPTTGLHLDDINKLIKIFRRLVENNNTVVIIEHHLDVIKCADYIIDLGPEGGDRGGEVVFAGTPEDIVNVKDSYTGFYLKDKLIHEKIT
ncbi:MAG: excinuclease ABC subunit UvrA [Deferribacterota bacterium]|nr:excinuclease ABC subunit UvrA [Deferribacterota bacterium]